MFQHIGIIGKPADERVAITFEKLVAFLRARSIQPLVEASSPFANRDLGLAAVAREALGSMCDLVIVIGGDGTFLSAARGLVDHHVPLLGINVARLGFLTDINPREMTEHLDEVLAGRYQEEQRFLLQAILEREGTPIAEASAFNDVVAHKWNIARLIEFETYIDSHLVYRQRSDGLIVSTPTGSTAYALAGGGPILYPSLNAIVLVPICAHTLSTRPLVVGGESRIEMCMDKEAQVEARLTCDGQTMLELLPGDRVLIRKKANPVRLIHPLSYDYYTTLRAKLGWHSQREP